MSKKIGIFAGTFDPVHDGHLAFAREALRAGLEKVMFLPEPRPRRKQGVRALEHRVAMVQQAVATESQMGTIALEQARFTVQDTLPLLQARFEGYKLVMLFGDDVMQHLVHWPHVNSLLEDCEMMIASRHQNATELDSTIKSMQKTRALKFDFQLVHPDQTDVTSSKIRLAIKHGNAVKGLDPAVLSYIKKQKLYTAVDESSGA